MLEVLEWLIDFLFVWGVVIGVAIAALAAWGISALLWDEFSMGLFVGLAIPFAAAGLYLQYKIEK